MKKNQYILEKFPSVIMRCGLASVAIAMVYIAVRLISCPSSLLGEMSGHIPDAIESCVASLVITVCAALLLDMDIKLSRR